MQIVKEELTEAGLTIIIKGKMNPAVASKLLPGGYSFMFEPDGMVKITLKLKDAEAKEPNAVQPSASKSSARDLGGEGENLDAVEGRTGNNQQDARKKVSKPAKKKEKVQTVRKKKN